MELPFYMMGRYGLRSKERKRCLRKEKATSGRNWALQKLRTEARDRVWRARGDSVLCQGVPGCLWKSNALSKLRWGLVGEARKSRQAKAVTRRGKTSINNRV